MKTSFRRVATRYLRCPERSGIGDQQAEAFVVADRRRGNVCSFGDFPDGEKWFIHVPT